MSEKFIKNADKVIHENFSFDSQFEKIKTVYAGLLGKWDDKNCLYYYINKYDIMLAETKDSIAGFTTVAGAGTMIMDFSSILSMALLITGVVLNIIRIYEIKKGKGKK